jgi:hypothetical protein
MNPEISTDLSGIPLQYQVYILYGGIALRVLGELYSAVRAGGGLKRIFQTIWCGEGVPKVIAEDYKKELSTPPFNEKK